MCRKLILLLAVVLGVIVGFSSVASAAIITGVVRSGGNSGDRAPIGPFTGNTQPLATQAGGLTDGNYVFSDREYTWINTPEDVDGAEYVRTFNTDKGSNVTYTVTFSSRATVLLTCDDRFGDLQAYADNIVRDFAAPGEFTDTGWDVFVGGDSDRQLSVFSAALPAGIYTFHAPPTGNNFYVIGAMPPPAPNRKAHNPTPEDGPRTKPSGVEGAGFYMLLEFDPGHGAKYHTAYFSEIFDDVNERNEDVCLGSPPWPEYLETTYFVGYDDETLPEFARVPLERNVIYYWVVDEANDTNDYPGDVWSFTIASEEAWGPSPADGARYVFGEPSVTLSWQMGDVDDKEYKVIYDVYHGADEGAVEAGTAALINVTEGTECTIGPLTAGEDYYWKVNTLLQLKHWPFSIFKTVEGYVWHFGTKPVMPIIDPTLIGWWRFDEGAGDVAMDWSGYDNDGVIVGGAERVPGKIEDAIELNGVNQRVDISLTDGVPTAVNPPEISIAMWVKPDMTSGTRTMFYVDELHRDNGGTGFGRIRCRINGGNWQFRSGEAVSQTNIDAVGPAVVTGEWVHYAGVKIDNDALYVYIDGALGGTANFGVGGILLPDCSIGGENDGDDPFGGLIDEVRLYLRGLSQSEIQHIMDPSAPYNPTPTDGEVDVAIGTKLTWSPGTDDSTGSAYTEHDVYFGTSFAEVESATEPVITLTGPNEYTPPALEYNTSYYWRIDGVNSGGVPYTGSVWTFRATFNPADVSDPHLKLWLKFDGDPCDSSGHGRHGTEYGGPVYVAGYDGEAISLDGVDDYVDVEHSVGISGADPRTIAGWAKARTTAISDWTNLFGFTGPSGAGGHFDIEIVGATDSTTAGYYGLHMYGDEYDIMPCDLEWHHLAATYDGMQANWYADAVHMGFAAPAVTINTPGDIHVGRRDDNTNYFPGTIDDVRIYDYVLNATQLATVMRINLAWAWNPNPGNGATGVGRTPMLTWTGGDYATSHYVFFGTDEDALPQVAGPQPTTSYNPGILDLGTTYYWAIGEANAAAPPDYMDRGRTWKFTTMDYLVIDNMDVYVPYDVPAGPHIFVAWRDGKGDCAGSGNNTGANLLETTPALFATSQLMQYDWDNDGFVLNPCTGTADDPRPYYYSKIEAQVAGLPSGIGSNWTMGGVKALSLLFYGDTLNSINDPLWVQLSDSSGPGEKVEYGAYADESLADIQDPNWHEWLIDLKDFDVQLSDVRSIAIGVGDENATSPHISSGTLYIDDVRLYTARCIPSRNSADFAKVDYAPEGAPDCVVNYKELEIMTRDWLDYDGAVIDIDAIDPGAANLVASYEFTGNFNDSSANAIHGTANGGVSTSYDADLGSAVAVFDGISGHVDLGNPPQLDFSTGSWAITAWIKPITTTDQHTVYCKGGDAAGGIRYMLTVAETNDHRMTVTTDDNSDKYQRHGDIQIDDGEWHHVVGMRDGTVLRVYVDGIDDGETTIPAGYDLSGTSQANAYIGANWNYETSVVQKFFHGSMDDVRVYNKALSQAEVISTMGLSELYSKVESVANIFDLEGDKNQVINFKDFCVLADNWGEEEEWPSW